jgi:AcrR family transcriptional regulator
MDMSSILSYAALMSQSGIAEAPKAKSMNSRRAATRARICEAANQLFFEQGFALVTMEHIAQAADIRRSTLYLHFSEKDEILAAIAEDYTAKLRPVIARLKGPKPTRDEIELWVADFAEFVSTERAATELLVSLSHLAAAPAPALLFGDSLMDMMAQCLPAMAQALEPGNEIARAWEIAVMDTLAWALCHHARHGVNALSRARLKVAAESLHRFVQEAPQCD